MIENAQQIVKNTNFLSLCETYLRSNAVGMQNGALKAETHKKLCITFISLYYNISNSLSEGLLVQPSGKRLTTMVRESTLPLTDYLDEAIGFPLESAPIYRRLTPKFAQKFCELAFEFIEESYFYTSDELLDVVSDICKHKFSKETLIAFESHNFSFKAGSGDEESRFLEVISSLGDRVRIEPQKFFGCSYEINFFNGTTTVK